MFEYSLCYPHIVFENVIQSYVYQTGVLLFTLISEPDHSLSMKVRTVKPRQPGDGKHGY